MSELTDFSVQYEWQEGSVPPPYHYEYTIRIGPGPQGEIVFRPDYPFNDPPVWIEELEVSAQKLAQLHTLMAEKEVFDRKWQQAPSVGGSSEWVEGTVSGRSFAVPSQLDTEDATLMSKVYQTIRSVVPDPVWAKLMARRKEYEQAFLQR